MSSNSQQNNEEDDDDFSPEDAFNLFTPVFHRPTSTREPLSARPDVGLRLPGGIYVADPADKPIG
jgi:hypothetical protein